MLENQNHSEIAWDFIVFVLRYYNDAQFTWFNLPNTTDEILRKEETKRVWLTLDHLVSKYDTFNEEFKNRNNLTAKALGEVFSYIDNIKKDINNIQSPDVKTPRSGATPEKKGATQDAG